MGIESYERISGNVVKELIEHASESSYQESTRHVTGGAISRQTVMKRLHSLQGLKVKEPASKRDVKVLYVNADEDHAALQSGRNTIVPLISIHEGIKKADKIPELYKALSKGDKEAYLAIIKGLKQDAKEEGEK